MITTIARHGAGLVLAATLGFVSSFAYGQVCNPTSPQPDPGTGFVPFGTAEQLLVRGGNSGPAWEWAVGTDTEAGQMAKGSLDWTPGRTFEWTLSYSGSGSATVQVRDQGNLVLSLSHPSGMDAGNALQFQVATNPSIGANTTVGATVTSINGMAVSGSLAQTGNNQQSAQNLYYFYPPMQQGLTAIGTVTLSYPVGQLPTGSRVDFLVRSGTIACQYTNQAPAVSISGPANNAVFNAPASITVSANASDTDGTIAQVEFYQSTTLIGTATTAPYVITWGNVAAGTYSLSAKATDNQGANTISAPVAIIVNSPPSVSLNSPASGALFNAPATVNLTATASDTDGTVTQVQFYQGASLIGTATSAPYSFTWTNVAAGSYTLTARATDDRGAVTISAPVSISVNALPTVNITTPASGTVVNAPATVTVSASAADPDGTIAKVDFYQGSTLIGTANATPYTITWDSVAAGSYQLTAVATDNRGATTTSAPVSVLVNALPTVSLTSPTGGATYNAPATITLTASASDTDGTVSKVDFYQGATLIGTATTAPYSFTWSNVAAGSYTLTAQATDDRGGVTSSTAVAITVNAPPATAITSPANNTVFTAPANITVTVSATDTDGTITKVDFYQGTNLIGTATAAPYSMTWNNIASGSYQLTAVATDNSGAITTSAPVTVIVNSPPSVALSSPANGASFNAPASIALAATASDSDGTIAKVDFYQGSTLIGTATTAPYNFAWNNVAAGSYTLSARATDDRGAITSSTSVSVVVNALPTVTITAPANNAVYSAPAEITVTATAGDADGSVAKVDFYQGTILIGTATASPHSMQWSNVASGTYQLTAVATDSSGATTTSSPITVRVNAAPTISLTSPVNNATFTSPATINLSATPGDSDGTIAKVEFLQGATVLATVTAAPYTFAWSNAQPGSYSLSARATDDLGATTASSAVAITVNAPGPMIYYIHPDHLNTPRLVADATGTTVWRWDQQEPFGNSPPNEDPDGDNVAFDFPLRFPGQYYDRETNLAYNWYRDYDGSLGRFIEPDPLGLDGGINVFMYANSPLSEIDPEGLMGRAPGTYGQPGDRVSASPIGPAAALPNTGPLGGKLGNPKHVRPKSLVDTEYDRCRAKCLRPALVGVGIAEGVIGAAEYGAEHFAPATIATAVKSFALPLRVLVLAKDLYDLYACLKPCDKSTCK